MKTSNLFTLNLADFAKGLLMAILTPAMLIIQQSLDAGVLVFNWKTIGLGAIAGGFAYLVKNFFTSPVKQ